MLRPVCPYVGWQWMPDGLRCPISSAVPICSRGLSSDACSGSVLHSWCSAGSLCRWRSHHPSKDSLDVTLEVFWVLYPSTLQKGSPAAPARWAVCYHGVTSGHVKHPSSGCFSLLNLSQKCIYKFTILKWMFWEDGVEGIAGQTELVKILISTEKSFDNFHLCIF